MCRFVLKECHHVVEPNGTIRVAVQDLEGIVHAYLPSGLQHGIAGEELGDA